MISVIEHMSFMELIRAVCLKCVRINAADVLKVKQIYSEFRFDEIFIYKKSDKVSVLKMNADIACYYHKLIGQSQS